MMFNICFYVILCLKLVFICTCVIFIFFLIRKCLRFNLYFCVDCSCMFFFYLCTYTCMYMRLAFVVFGRTAVVVSFFEFLYVCDLFLFFFFSPQINNSVTPVIFLFNLFRLIITSKVYWCMQRFLMFCFQSIAFV